MYGATAQLYTAYYYDIQGRVTRTVQTNLLGGYDKEETVYTFDGRPQKVTRTHTASGKTTQTEVYDYTYDHAARLTKVEHTLNGNKVTLATYTYDELGRLQSKTPHGNAANKLTYSYNIRGWLTYISGNKFMQELFYIGGVGTPQYNGNISSMTWRSGDESALRGYQFTYDGLDRLTLAKYGENPAMDRYYDIFNEKVTAYDKNGNILGLQRNGQLGAGDNYGMIDNLTFTLNGNQLSRVDDAVGTAEYNGGFEFRDAVQQADEYAYDANGNLTKDLNRNISNIEYNFLNLPSKVTFTDGSTITYVYAADGTKLRTVHNIGGTTTTTDYCGNVVYENGTQKYLLTEEGYVTLADNRYHYYLKDHQGNNRVVVDGNGTVEEVNHYYPFGGVFALTSSVQPYKYNGKELDTKNGLNWYDYGARHYDPSIGRFTTMDPMAKDYYGISPYTYCLNEPIRLIDPDGKKVRIGTFWQRVAASLGFENYVTKVTRQLEQNNMDSRRIQAAYAQLENSELEFKILPLSESPLGVKKGNHVIPDAPVDVRGKKQGATMYYDPNMGKTVSGIEREPRIGLAHETGHLEDFMNGKVIPIHENDSKDMRDIKMELNERTSLEFENEIREILNYEERDKYNRK